MIHAGPDAIAPSDDDSRPWADPAPYPPIDGTQPCTDLDPETFFPNGETRNTSTTIAIPVAVAACRRCPFMRPCLAFALTHDVAGIWGATSHEQRRRIQAANDIRPITLYRHYATEGSLE